MKISINSPLPSEVFNELSPPPTPIAKRGRHFFPSNAAVPMFFPKSQSIFGSAHAHPNISAPTTAEKEATEMKRLLASLAHRPVPRLHLSPMPKSKFGKDSTNTSRAEDMMQLQADQLPTLPYLEFPEEQAFLSESCTIYLVRPVHQNEEWCMSARKLQRIKRRLFLEQLPNMPSFSSEIPSIASSNSAFSLPTPNKKPSGSSTSAQQHVKLPSGMHRRTSTCQVKLPSFQRGGMVHRRTVSDTLMGSFAASAA